jgi:Alphavirus glycoprotein J
VSTFCADRYGLVPWLRALICPPDAPPVASDSTGGGGFDVPFPVLGATSGPLALAGLATIGAGAVLKRLSRWSARRRAG